MTVILKKRPQLPINILAMARIAPTISDDKLFDFKEIKQRFFALNKSRLQRAIADMRQRQQDFLEMLPMLYHINHPMLPGYVSKNTPAGIPDYSPTATALQLAKKMAKSFAYKKRAYRRFHIQAIYMMGSTGTIAYSNHSDFDIWVCYDNSLKPEQVTLLEKKSRAIEEWAASLDVDAHIFLVNPEEFRNKQHGELSTESSGSALHYLLLEEFYRTSLLIAGLYPVWWLVPPEHEKNYDAFVKDIKRKRFIHSRDNIDFGGLNKVPAEEFYGATLWSLYKGIHSPYKSVLKTLLMESYASEYPNIDILGLRFKQAIYNGENEINKLDPYLMMLHKAEEYLENRNESKRLDLIRRSFYFKVDEKLSQNSDKNVDGWRRLLLGELVQAWGWSISQLFILDSKEDWKIHRVQEERNTLIQEMTNSYRFLSNFARNHTDSNLIHEDDLHLLGRKLYAAFERKAGKVEVIYQGITESLFESHLSLHRLLGEDQREFWVVFSGIVNEGEAAYSSPLKRAHSLVEVLSWCFFNRIITSNTNTAIYTYGADLTNKELQSLVNKMERCFDDNTLANDNINALRKPAKIEHVLTIINAGIDPFIYHTRRGEHLTSNRTDSLRYGGRLENLSHSIDQIIFTSWHEVLTYRYVGVEGLFKCLQDYTRWSPPSSGKRPPSINAVSYSSYRGNAIAERIEKLFNGILDCFYNNPRNTPKYYVLAIEWDYYVLQLENDLITYQKAGDLEGLIKHLSRPAKKYRQIVFDEQTLSDDVLPVLYGHDQPGIIQVFFQIYSGHVRTYILDELGSLFVHDTEFYDAITLINQYQQFIDSAQQRIQYLNNTSHTDKAKIKFSYLEKDFDSTWKIVKHHSTNLFVPSHFINLQVIADKIDNEIIFRAYCDGVEFSNIEYGDKLYLKVADYIIAKRSRHEHYPIYITDIDISKSLLETNNARIQTIQFLQYKKLFEVKLGVALKEL